MADLSPAAQAAWEAFNDVAERVGVFEDYGDALAAFTRALADQVVPHEEVQLLLRGHELERLCQRQRTRAELLAIAAELEGQQ
jgi:hypothetical protein